MKTLTPKVPAFALVGALLLGACASSNTTETGAPDSLAFEARPIRPSTTLVESAPDIDMTDEEELITSFEARWICTMQAEAFESAGAIEETRDELLVEYGIETSTYTSFRDTLEANRDLRDVVLFKYQEQCG